MKIANMKEAEAILAEFVPMVKRQAHNKTLQRVYDLAACVGNPQEKLSIIHVAGTSGKTSTCYYIAGMYAATGLKTGLTVSPHIDSVAERIQINGQPISEQKFCDYLGEFLELIDVVRIQPTYFEVLIVFAYWVFGVKEKVDVAVIETGCGGLLDGTNIVHNPTKVCVITDIGLDHMHLLGGTIPEIAMQKAGIIHEGNQVLIYEQTEEIDSIFATKSQNEHADISVINFTEACQNLPSHARDLPMFQQRNWLLARNAFVASAQRFGFDVGVEDAADQSIDTYVPARMDVRNVQGKRIVMDGAHNEQKMQAFVESFKAQYPNKRVPVLLALKDDKDHAAVVSILRDITSELIVTEFAQTQDLPSISGPAVALAGTARDAGFDHVLSESDHVVASKVFLDKVQDVGVVTGSFYLIAQVRHEGLL